jgi:hypothetical protein
METEKIHISRITPGDVILCPDNKERTVCKKDIIMTHKELMRGEENEVLGYAVFREHTLGYLFRIGDRLQVGILHTSILKGSPFGRATESILIFPTQFKDIREATQKDFDDFRVSSKGHLIPAN